MKTPLPDEVYVNIPFLKSVHTVIPPPTPEIINDFLNDV